MDKIIDQCDAWVLALIFGTAMLASWGLGWWRGQRAQPEQGEDPGVKFIDGSVALLGLLLAFTFSMVLGRHDQRRLTLVAESNALGDLYTCASLLKEPSRSKLQNITRDYTKNLLSVPPESLAEADEQMATHNALAVFARMTGIVDEALAAGTPIAVPLTNTLNNVTSTSAARIAAYREKLPWSIVALLCLSSMVPAHLIGEKQGALRNVHFSGSFTFIILVTLVVYVTLDLNQPRRGLIRISQAPLERVMQSMAD